MINKLYRNITTGLKLVRNLTIYQEEVSQRFEKPSFLIVFYDQKPRPGINHCLNNTVRVDIAYFPEDPLSPQTECWNVGQDLMREFRIEDFKIKNRNMKITDNVLHFLFDVDYREYREEDLPKQQTLSPNVDLKEV